MKRNALNIVPNLSLLKIENLIAVFTNCFLIQSIVLFVALLPTNAQTWSQLGAGAGGQVRALYVDKVGANYDVYVGSDVSGLWKAEAISDLNNQSIYSTNKYKYISNNEIMRFINKIYYPQSFTSNFLFVGSQSGIHTLQKGVSSPSMKNIYPMSDGWVSDMYISEQNISGTHNIYFVTGNTRVSDDDPDNHKIDRADFYWGELNAAEDEIINVDSVFFFGMPANHRGDVSRILMDEEFDTNFNNDTVYVGSETGLYVFTLQIAINNAGGTLPNNKLIPNPDGSNSPYEVTSITRVQSSDILLVTIHGLGVFKYDTHNQVGWVGIYPSNNLIGLLKARKYNDDNIVSDVKAVVKSFTQLKPLTDNSGNTNGYLLFNEEPSTEVIGSKYFAGVFYSPATAPDFLPSSDWLALTTATGNSWGWNATRPCANINSNWIVNEPGTANNNLLLIGKQGNLFATQDTIAGAGTVNWQQIYTDELTVSCGPNTDKKYKHMGYVNTAAQAIFWEWPNSLWYSERDRQLSFSDDNGTYSMQVTDNSICKNIGLGTPQPACSIPVTGDYNLSDCLFITNNTIDNTDTKLYAGIAEGFGFNKARGMVMTLNSGTTTWNLFADVKCFDPKKLLFSSNNDLYLYATGEDGDLVYYLNNNQWHVLTLFTNGVIDIDDVVMSPDGNNMFVIRKNENIYWFTKSSQSSWMQAGSTVTNANVANKILAVLKFENNTKYKVLCGTHPKNYTNTYDNFYEIYESGLGMILNAITSNCTSTCNYAGSDIFKQLIRKDKTDAGITAIEVNHDLSTLYVGSVSIINGEVKSHLYRGTFNSVDGTIDNCWNEITGTNYTTGMPNKSVQFITSRGSTFSDERLFACVRGLGEWKNEIDVFRVQVTKTDLSCNGSDDGIATASGFGGLPPYNFDWGAFGTGATITGLAAGTYTVTITDANNCTLMQSVLINEPQVLSVSESHVNILCNGDPTGSIDITVSGGTTPYVFLWNDADQNEDRSNLYFGNYTVTITDANGCTTTQSVIITQPNQLSININPTEPSCFLGSNGKADAIASGGTSPYSYHWNTGAVTSTTTLLSAGVYTVTVSDNNGCSVTASIILSQPSQLTATASQTVIGCTASNNGEAEVSPQGGTAPYSFTWSPSGGNQSTAIGLVPNIYIVNVTDANGCSTTASVTIIEDANCCGVFGNTYTYNPGSNPPSGSYDLNASFSVAAGTTLTLSTCTLAIAKNASITVEPNATLEVLASSFLYSCGDMWNGIINNGGTVVIDNSEIDDAENALFSDQPNSIFIINLSRFDRNYISVNLSNFDYSVNSTFQNSFFICPNTLKSPHLGAKTLQQFYVSNAIVNIGNAGTTPVNVIQDANDGIYADNTSTIIVDNCVFNELANTGNLNAAINANNGTTLTVGVNAANTFGNCAIAAYCNSNYTTRFQNNLFQNCMTGVYAEHNGYNNIQITFNTFRECNAYATFVADLNKFTVGVNINNNYFYAEKDAAGTPISQDAITVFNWTQYVIPVHINNNHIDDYINGIYVTNLHGNAALNTINNNIINYTFTDAEIGSSNFYRGITAIGCDKLRVYRNQINWTGGPANPQPYNWQMTGYYFQECINSSIFKNDAVQCGTGMYLRGQCPNTFLICNHFDKVYPGISMYQLYLDQQGSLCSSNQNNWTGSYTGGVTDYNKIRGSVTSPIDWYYDSPSTNPSPFDPFGIINPIATTCTSYPPACGTPDEAVEEYDAQERLINGVIGDSIPYGDDANENRYKAQAYIYDAMKENDTLINTTEREQYMNQAEQSNIGLFVAVTDSLATDNLYEADVINATIIDTNLIESNIKAVNDIILRLAQSDTMQLTASDSATLDYISLQDPITGGNAVYEARALLHRKIYDPNNGNNLRLASENSSVSLNEIELFPNPAKNFILIKLNSFSEGFINLVISDVTGRKLLEKSVGCKTNLYKIDLTEFPPGSYCIKINTSGNNQFSKQFVLVR